jgi:hypothetical protein
MESTAHTTQATTHSVTTEKKEESTFWKNAELDRFGYIPILLIILGCVGGFAAALCLEASIVALLTITITSGVSLAMMLAGAPMKILLGSVGIAVLIDLIMIFTHLG